MNLILKIKIVVTVVCLTSSVVVSAQSFEIPLGSGQIAPTTFSNSNNAVIQSGQDLISFAQQNNIPLVLNADFTAFGSDDNVDDMIFSETGIDVTGIVVTSFEVGSVIENNQGGQNIRFINGDFFLLMTLVI